MILKDKFCSTRGEKGNDPHRFDGKHGNPRIQPNRLLCHEFRMFRAVVKGLYVYLQLLLLHGKEFSSSDLSLQSHHLKKNQKLKKKGKQKGESRH